MIPKTIHYIWFGTKPKPEIFSRCKASWELHCSDYEIVEWGAQNFISDSAFFDYCIKNNQLAFASDYARAAILYQHGGIYMGTDVELHDTLDPFLMNRAFSGFETTGLPFTAVWGTEPLHPWPQAVLEHYNQLSDARCYTTNTTSVSKILVDKWGVDPSRDETQHLADGICIYESTSLCLLGHNTTAEHHFEGSWLREDKTRRSFKEFLKERHLVRQLLQLNGFAVSADKTTRIEYENLAKMSIERIGRAAMLRLIMDILARIVELSLPRQISQSWAKPKNPEDTVSCNKR